MNIKYQEIENHLSSLLKALEQIFSSSEIAEVHEFIDYGEYGSALDTVMDIITEENKIINNYVLTKIINIYITMDLDFDISRNKLSKYIIE